MTRKMSRIYIFLEYPIDIPHISHILRCLRDILSQGISHIVGRPRDILSQGISRPRLDKRNISRISRINPRDDRERI